MDEATTKERAARRVAASLRAGTPAALTKRMRRTILTLASCGLVACGGGGGGGGDASGACDAGSSPQMIKGTPVTADEPQPWTTGSIAIVSQNGDVTVVGDSSDGKVHITATPFVMASPCDTGVQDALADIASGIHVSPGGSTSCSYASKAYGTVSRSSTGCTDVTVHVPHGTTDSPVSLAVHTFNGSIAIQNVNLADHDCLGPGPDGAVPITCPVQYLNPPVAQADHGDITISGATGSVYATTGGGSITASDTPNPPVPEETPLGAGVRRSYVLVESTDGDATLSLPSDFAADALTLWAYPGTVTVTGFPGLGPNSLDAGAPDTGAAVVTVTAQKGNVTLSAM